MELWSKIHDICIIWMTAVIWCVQLIIYPAFRKIERSQFIRFHDFHSRNITFIVAPPMLLELATAHAMFWLEPGNLHHQGFMVGIHLIFLSTIFKSIPFHHSLQKGYSESAAIKLERYNWIRTILWSIEFVWVAIKFVE